MKKKRYTEEQITGAIKQHESGVKVDDICRQLTFGFTDFFQKTSSLIPLDAMRLIFCYKWILSYS